MFAKQQGEKPLTFRTVPVCSQRSLWFLAGSFMELLGIDIGGSGIKGAMVNTTTGKLITERLRLKTPQPSTPEAVAATIKELVDIIR